jgi:hypothetical protein
MAIRNTSLTALAQIAASRDHINTHECGHAINRSAQTLRKLYCIKGTAYGMVPLKVGSRLLWSVEQVAALLTGGAHE